jgi:hypothetical protein
MMADNGRIVWARTCLHKLILCKLPEQAQAVVVIGNESNNPLLPIDDVTEILQLANVLKHEVQRVSNALYHCHMWIPAMALAYMRHSEMSQSYRS